MPDEDRARLLDAIEGDLADIELALARLDAGSYEICEVCAGPITDDVLAGGPATRRCAGCAGGIGHPESPAG